MPIACVEDKAPIPPEVRAIFSSSVAVATDGESAGRETEISRRSPASRAGRPRKIPARVRKAHRDVATKKRGERHRRHRPRRSVDEALVLPARLASGSE